MNAVFGLRKFRIVFAWQFLFDHVHDLNPAFISVLLLIAAVFGFLGKIGKRPMQNLEQYQGGQSLPLVHGIHEITKRCSNGLRMGGHIAIKAHT